MLFKPVKAYYLFGKKLPFTPGLIPAKREKLAEAIGKVVKENLLTQELLVERLNHQKVRESLNSLVESFLEEFAVNSEVYFRELTKKVSEKSLGEVLPFDELYSRGELLVDHLLSKLEGKKLKELLPEGLYREVEGFISEKVEELSSSIAQQIERGELKELIYATVRTNLERLRALLPFLTPQVLEPLSLKAADFLEELALKAAREPSFKLKLSKVLWSKFHELLNRELKGELLAHLSPLLKRAVREYLKSYEVKKVGDFKGLLEEELPVVLSGAVLKYKGSLARLISERLLELIERELPVIMEAVDVEAMVRDKVNSLPIEEVEEIVLKLIDEELRHITLLGGVLGFLIGLTQLLLI